MSVTDSEPNRTEPNHGWPQRQRPNVAGAHTPAHARIAEVGEGSTLTEGDDHPEARGFLDAVRDQLIGDVDRIWPTEVPTTEALLRYGAEGQQLSPNSAWRPAAKGYAKRVAVPQTWNLYARAWVWQRPLRLLALLAVIVLVNLLIPGSTPTWAWAFLIGFLL
jgi:hypothetical protein